jgi:hypothetical protein
LKLNVRSSGNGREEDEGEESDQICFHGRGNEGGGS